METSSFEPPKKKRKHKNENWQEDVTNESKTADKKGSAKDVLIFEDGCLKGSVIFIIKPLLISTFLINNFS